MRVGGYLASTTKASLSALGVFFEKGVDFSNSYPSASAAAGGSTTLTVTYRKYQNSNTNAGFPSGG